MNANELEEAGTQVIRTIGFKVWDALLGLVTVTTKRDQAEKIAQNIGKSKEKRGRVVPVDVFVFSHRGQDWCVPCANCTKVQPF